MLQPFTPGIKILSLALFLTAVSQGGISAGADFPSCEASGLLFSASSDDRVFLLDLSSPPGARVGHLRYVSSPVDKAVPTSLAVPVTAIQQDHRIQLLLPATPGGRLRQAIGRVACVPFGARGIQTILIFSTPKMKLPRVFVQTTIPKWQSVEASAEAAEHGRDRRLLTDTDKADLKSLAEGLRMMVDAFAPNFAK
jgi:hypothetical protein